jgi:hypothetical protein
MQPYLVSITFNNFVVAQKKDEKSDIKYIEFNAMNMYISINIICMYINTP